jgi:LEA14-like dessication related protein
MKKHLLRFSFVVALASASVAMNSCDAVLQSARGAYNMTNCQYSYQSMTGLSVAGIDPSNLSVLDAPRILTLLSGNASSLPVGFTLNLGVQNPNATEAMLSGLDYVLSVDGVDFTSGSLDRQRSVPAGGTGILPLAMAFDVATLLKGETGNAASKAVKNLIGMGGGEASRVTLNVRPAFMVGGYKVVSPVYVPIHFNFGGK